MILDKDTNKLFLAFKLREKHLNVLEQFDFSCSELGIPLEFVDDTNDIWMRDFMPIQIEKDYFIGYKYMPDYLTVKPEYRATITDGNKVSKELGFNVTPSDIVIDGGNVIKAGKHVIMVEKVFKENPSIPKIDLINRLENLFKAEIIFIHWDKLEYMGHADGVVRPINEDTLLLTNYFDFSPNVFSKFTGKLAKYYDIKVLRYNVKEPDKRNWSYINFLRIGNVIFLPQLTPKPFIYPSTQANIPASFSLEIREIEEDDQALEQFKTIFPDCEIIPIYCHSLIDDGGALNCISWNIKI